MSIKRFLCPAILFATLCHPAARAASPQPAPGSCLEELRRLAGRGERQQAAQHLKSCLAADPQATETGLSLARYCLEQNLSELALTAADEVLRRDLENREAFSLAIRACLQLGREKRALAYWQSLGWPKMSRMEVTSRARTDRNRIAEEVGLLQDDPVSLPALQAGEWNLLQHKNIRGVRFVPRPDADMTRAVLDVQVDSQNGFGDPFTFLTNTFSGIFDNSLRLTYWNWGQSGISVEGLFRRHEVSRLGQFELSSPRLFRRILYSRITYSWRDEDWRLWASPDTLPNRFRLRRHDLTPSILIPIRSPYLAVRLEGNYRWRAFQAEKNSASGGTTWQTEGFRNQSAAEIPHRVFWLRVSPSSQWMRREFQSGAAFTSTLQLSLEKGWMFQPGRDTASRASFSTRNLWIFPTWKGRSTSLQVDGHAGALSNPGPVEDHFLLGTGIYADYLLRAHPLFSHYQYGRSPALRKFLLGNLTASRDLFSWHGVVADASGFLDAARNRSSYPGQYVPRTLLDTGFGLGFRLGEHSPLRVTVAYGHDWRENKNVFYFTTRFR